MTITSKGIEAAPNAGRPVWRTAALLAAIIGLGMLMGCGSKKTIGKQQEFFTSGSREADQRASQRMAKNEQLTGSGEGAGEKKTEKAQPAAGKPVQAEGKASLFDRLGADKGLTAIVEDFMPRALQDPRVNWARVSVRRGGLFHRGPAVTWKPTPENVTKLKQHMVQFLALATGGPAHYEGKELQTDHAAMRISNPEFDAAVGDLKASLDKLRIANQEQKELLAIIESTRPEIVTQR